MTFLRAALLMLWIGLYMAFTPSAVHAAGGANAGGMRVAVVTGAADGAYQETTQALRSALLAEVPTAAIEEFPADGLSAGTLADRRMIVTVGSKAAQAVAQLGLTRPVLHTLLPGSAYERLPRPREGVPTSAIFLDQPPERQIALLRLALPEWQRVALISGAGSEGLARRLSEAAAARQLQVQATSISSDGELYAALQSVLAEPAVLVAIPDTQVFNSYTVQNVLLTAYRNRSPVLGFSAAYIRAGALLGLYSTPSQIGTQAAGVVARVLQGERLPAPASPARFEVGINPSVARSLGITLKPAEQLTAELLRRETSAP